MIKQTQLVFRIGSLEVFQITIIGGPPPLHTVSDPTVSRIEEIWWVDKTHPQGVGPFPTVFSAMKDYEKTLQGKIDAKDGRQVAEIIHVDFKAKKRRPLDAKT